MEVVDSGMVKRLWKTSVGKCFGVCGLEGGDVRRGWGAADWVGRVGVKKETEWMRLASRFKRFVLRLLTTKV
jgi:hypothetical protein